MIKYVPEKLLKNMNPSLWKISVYWSTGVLKDVYFSLDDETKEDIIDELNFNFRIKKDELGNILDIINKLRNRICHNNMLYEFEYKPKERRYPYPIIKFLKREVNHKTNKIRLCQVVKILDIINNNGSSILMKKIKRELNNLENKILDSMDNQEYAKEIFNNVKKYMKF